MTFTTKVKRHYITFGKADTIYSALSNTIEKCSGIGFGNDGPSVIIRRKKLPQEGMIPK